MNIVISVTWNQWKARSSLLILIMEFMWDPPSDLLYQKLIFNCLRKKWMPQVCLSLIILKKLKRIWNSLVQRYLCILEQNELLCNYQVACYHNKKGRNNWKWNPRPQVWEPWQWNSERELERKRENKGKILRHRELFQRRKFQVIPHQFRF